MHRRTLYLALLIGVLPTADVAAQMQIHELVYDGVGTDGDEVFTELTGPAGLSLEGWILEGINGGSGTVYRSIDLDGVEVPTDGVLVLATDQAAGDVLAARDLVANVDWQNGPDAIRLIAPSGVVADALQYGDAAQHNAGEGAPAPKTAAGEALSRDELGTDTHDNAHDFHLSVPSPGVAIVALPPGATLSLPDTVGRPGERLVLPLRISDNETGLLAAEVAIIFDAQVLTPVTIEPAAETVAWQIAAHVAEGIGWQDTLRVALATDVDTLRGDAALLKLTFRVDDRRVPGISALQLTQATLDDGTTAPRILPGATRRVGDDAVLTADSLGSALPHRLQIQVVDPDEDRNDGPDTVRIAVTEGDSTESVLLVEDDAHPGRFSGSVELRHAAVFPGDGVVQTRPRQTNQICYTDHLDAQGATSSRCIQWWARGHDAQVEISQVIEPGDTLWLRVDDVDLNRDSLPLESATVALRSSSDSTQHLLTRVTPELSVYDGAVVTTTSVAGPGSLRVIPGDLVIVTYLDSAGSAADSVERSDTTLVIERFGDADGNGLLQAFDANAILHHVVTPALSRPGTLAANIDSLAPNGAVTPLDASLLLQQRVGQIARFPVQSRAGSINHPGPQLTDPGARPIAGSGESADGTSSPVPPVVDPRAVSLRADGDDLLVWLSRRDGVVAADVSITGLASSAADLADAEAGEAGFLVAHHRNQSQWHIALAGAMPMSGVGPLLRLRNTSALPSTRLERVLLNDRPVVVHPPPALIPGHWRLESNHPNPFNGSTSVPLHLPRSGRVRAVVYNMLGQPIRQLQAGNLPAGEHILRWDGRDDGGVDMATGVYILRVRVRGVDRQQRVMLLR